MSNTSNKLNLDPKRLIVFYSPTVLSIIAGGLHRRFYAKESGEDLLREIYNTAKAYKETEEARYEEQLQRYLDPDFRQKIDHGLVQDLQGNYYLEELPHLKVDVTIKEMLDRYRERGLDPSPVMNLWKLALDNPSEQSRKDLMSYIEQFGIPVTDSGYMILYKSVRDKNDVIEKLAYVVGKEYFEKMRRRDQNPRDWWVYEMPQDAVYRDSADRFFVANTETDMVYEREIPGEERAARAREEYNNEHDFENDPHRYDEGLPEIEEVPLQPIGNLAELFGELILDKRDLEATDEETEPVFEPYYRGDYGMEIRLGVPVTMPRDKCDPNIDRDCSEGLHVGSYEYVHKFHPRDGSVLACLVNPRDIVALPATDHSKIRTCAYLPYGIISVDEDGNWEEAETSYWEESFLDYEKQEVEDRIQSLQEELQHAPERSAARIEELLQLAENRLVQLNS